MKIYFNIKDSFIDPFVTINAKEKTKSLEELAVDIERITKQKLIYGYVDNQKFAIPLQEIIRFYTYQNIVYCKTDRQNYRIKQRIYQLNNLLSAKEFVQISSSEVVNLDYVKQFSLSKLGSYEVRLKNNEILFASRRFVQKIKRELI
ncbi:hypothetical protein BGL34_00180 [Fructilactobacillus lindneri]|uniref:HTH LytTR-type domain-containing protein n=2 Tax=Fructilactobacillus lindneri TaxID=53444 RepID=A0A0R2JQ49_9LACO|nr:LytTR family DNA-binding domain-containing protein [Fructilactobacillus lindneri]ANZ58384.1 hypothetical protein AYR60_06400 [Fructilactobacillus lindneri]ANZ59706.1 hypothetical protein AYR59_06655 [Fructilactobacillus lindneri]KRN79224.1 hypothetical protein IV52_GL000631 [Fructilactobacillus lindneri DSM 20690 = JCM 11027]POG98512.1 hypothetical protein BGL31_00770 [Fructilactobacillus lindneri]POH03900.1 hypothetical protein BGL32_00710 [Fructilactobacillus lindneri]